MRRASAPTSLGATHFGGAVDRQVAAISVHKRLGELERGMCAADERQFSHSTIEKRSRSTTGKVDQWKLTTNKSHSVE